MFASKATRTGVQLPSPPVYARSGSGERRLSRRNCSEGGPVSPCHINAASFDSASQSHRTLAAVAESEVCHAVALRRRTFHSSISVCLKDYGLASQQMHRFFYVYILVSATKTFITPVS